MTVREQLSVKNRRTRGRPKLEDTAVIEKKLLASALNEFLQHGYGGTSMSRIVKAAGMSKTTLYSRFSSKEALFRAIMHQQIDQLGPSSLLQAHTDPPALEEGLKSYANRMIEQSLQGEFLGVNRLIYSESHRFPELGATAAERTALGIARISRFIRQCAAADGLECKDPDGIAEIFILMIRGWYVNIILTNREVSVAEREHWVERAVRNLLAGRSEW